MTIPDSAFIDTLRGVTVGMGALLLLMLIRLRFTRGLPKRTRRVIYALILFTLPVLATEVEQIGERFLIWRLPLAVLAFGAGLRWCALVQMALKHDQEPL